MATRPDGGPDAVRFAIEDDLGWTVSDVRPVPGGDIARAFRVEADGHPALFAKTVTAPPPGFFAAEARGLRLLAAAGPDGVPVPSVVVVRDDVLVLEWIEQGSPTAQHAEDFGRRLALTHAAGFDVFGSTDGSDGYIGTLRLPGGPWETWTAMWAEGRVVPYLRAASDAGSLSPADRRDIEKLLDRLDDVAGPAEAPARIHGDLWSGNVVWSRSGPAHLIDPAAHGGHRETDLAMLALFGLPHLDRVLAAYDDTVPLADGWRDRIPLHQLHPVLVHAVLFGGSYGAHAGSLARRVLRASPSARS